MMLGRLQLQWAAVGHRGGGAATLGRVTLGVESERGPVVEESLDEFTIAQRHGCEQDDMDDFTPTVGKR